MARQRRINFKNAWYHVMNRGAGFRHIYLDDRDREKFLELLSKTSTQYQIEIHSYCLMSNHYHLLVKTPMANLSEAVKYLNSLYARYFNKKMNSDGPIFRGRFKSTIVSEDFNLLEVSRYIHLNPVKACMVKKPQDYLWSSYRAFLLLSGKPSLLTTEFILKLISTSSDFKSYQIFVEHPQEDNFEEKYEGGKWVTILGPKEFSKAILRLHQAQSSEVTNVTELARVTMDDIKHIVARHYQVSFESINYPQLMKKNIARSIAVWLSRKVGRYSLKEVANAFMYRSYSSVSVSLYRLEKQGKHDVQLMTTIHQLTEQVEALCNKKRYE